MGPPCPVTGMAESASPGMVTPVPGIALGMEGFAVSLAGLTGCMLHSVRANPTITAKLRLVSDDRQFVGLFTEALRSVVTVSPAPSRTERRRRAAQAQNQLFGAGSIETANAWLTTAVIVSPTFTWDSIAIRAGSVTLMV